ncbi:LIPA [Mytilus coruscus]|uniref:LIPA n=1 Tax=Mytilus coruscus TaxID=42192 RepID=A0A6J8B7M5_MYTCO|nr:LIPA [Mytilus coruscus]
MSVHIRNTLLACTFSLTIATPLFTNGIISGQKIDPDAYKNVSQLITSKGYPFEEHLVETADGYILGLHRIPPIHKQGNNQSRPVILLQHGLLSCSACWVENLANQSLGFILADRGMDVWMGNSRGNTYSKRHKTLKPTDEKFWDFTWDEMAKYDLPSTVDYIAKTTNVSQIYYAGHSQGTEIIFAELGRNQTLAAKIKHFFALAPVATMGNATGPFKAVAPYAQDIDTLFQLLGKGEFLPSSDFISSNARKFCGNDYGSIVCENLIFLLAGYDSKEINRTRIPVYVEEHPAGTSVKNFLHYAQVNFLHYAQVNFLLDAQVNFLLDAQVNFLHYAHLNFLLDAQAVLSGKFQMFDYSSPAANMGHYNQTTPPLYDASLMKNSVSLYSGGNDIIADPTDVKLLLQQLPNIYRHINITTYEHLDFIWATEAKRQCYDDIILTIVSRENL